MSIKGLIFLTQNANFIDVCLNVIFSSSIVLVDKLLFKVLLYIYTLSRKIEH